MLLITTALTTIDQCTPSKYSLMESFTNKMLMYPICSIWLVAKNEKYASLCLSPKYLVFFNNHMIKVQTLAPLNNSTM
jgi:hypothetical protein